VANHDAIKAHDAEVVVVFPVASAADRTEAARFTAAVDRDARRHDGVGGATTPFPVVLDVGLGAIERLGLRADLAKPANYVLDKEGRVRFAYVGQSPADRPSVKAILGQLSALADAPP
jgi:peroxiredoxin